MYWVNCVLVQLCFSVFNVFCGIHFQHSKIFSVFICAFGLFALTNANPLPSATLACWTVRLETSFSQTFLVRKRHCWTDNQLWSPRLICSHWWFLYWRHQNYRYPNFFWLSIFKCIDYPSCFRLWYSSSLLLNTVSTDMK